MQLSVVSSVRLLPPLDRSKSQQEPKHERRRSLKTAVLVFVRAGLTNQGAR